MTMNNSEKTADKSRQRTVEGRVVSNKMDKTVTVLVERQVKHALYGKYIRRSSKLHAHDADNSCTEGDVVRVVEIAPMSKTKNWRVDEIVSCPATYGRLNQEPAATPPQQCCKHPSPESNENKANTLTHKTQPP